MKKLNYEDLQEMYNDFVICSGRDFWKYLVIEKLLSREEELEITEEEIDNIVNNIIDNDYLWQEIDNEVSREINFSKYNKKEEK